MEAVSGKNNEGEVMGDTVVFGGINALDFQDIRSQVIRIPEVRLRLSEAQEFWDSEVKDGFCFHEFLSSEDPRFFSNSSLKSISLALVQVGLFDRYVRLFSKPSIIVGDSRNDSALLVASGVISLTEMLSRSRAFFSVTGLNPVISLNKASGLPTLNGSELAQFESYERVEEKGGFKYRLCGDEAFQLEVKLMELCENKYVNKVVHVGPGLLSRAISERLGEEVQILESIDLDPMLSWFWNTVRKAQASA